MRFGTLWLGTVMTLLLPGCSDIVGSDEPWCPSGDPAPFACARLLALVEGPAEPWPSLRKVVLRAYPARDLDEPTFVTEADTGAVPILLVDHLIPIETLGDTVSMWFKAEILEIPDPLVTGEPLPVFAVDSTVLRVDFTVRKVDTVRLRMRRP
ncbi:MAG: hypothetical protein PVJ02_05290 [Gemmatimonadota bacterium]|jgi:hypothetical protein